MMKHVLATAALLAAGAAQAVTFSSTPGAPDPGAATTQAVLVDFEAPVAGVTYSGSYTIDNMNTGGFRAEPAGDTTNYFGVPKNEDPLPNSATIDFTSYLSTHKAFRSLSFYWGSTDSYNTLTLIGSGLTGQTVFTGDDVNAPANGDQTAPATNRRVYFRFADGETLTGLQLGSTQRAFEIDDIATSAVPEPTMWAMLLTGFGLVGMSVRRRSRAIAA